MYGFAIGFLVLFAACTQTAAEEALSVCQPLCRCAEVPLPAAQRACLDDCVTEVEQNPLGDECVACVIEHADRCLTLVDDCSPVCIQSVSLSSDGVGNAPGIED
jgi:hypothetical protein